MSARELKRALEEMVRRCLVSNLSLCVCVCVCVCVSFESNLGEHGNEDDDAGCSVQENAMSMIKYAFKNTIFRI